MYNVDCCTPERGTAAACVASHFSPQPSPAPSKRKGPSCPSRAARLRAAGGGGGGSRSAGSMTACGINLPLDHAALETRCGNCAPPPPSHPPTDTYSDSNPTASQSIAWLRPRQGGKAFRCSPNIAAVVGPAPEPKSQRTTTARAPVQHTTTSMCVIFGRGLQDLCVLLVACLSDQVASSGQTRPSPWGGNTAAVPQS